MKHIDKLEQFNRAYFEGLRLDMSLCSTAMLNFSLTAKELGVTIKEAKELKKISDKRSEKLKKADLELIANAQGASNLHILNDYIQIIKLDLTDFINDDGTVNIPKLKKSGKGKYLKKIDISDKGAVKIEKPDILQTYDKIQLLKQNSINSGNQMEKEHARFSFFNDNEMTDVEIRAKLKIDNDE